MTEQVEHETYIKCFACKCKYINDDDNIRNDFGYNRLNVRYKCCVKCRDKQNQDYKINGRAINDAQRRCCVPCSICNIRIYKYQMDKHQASAMCPAYAEWAKKAI